MRIDGMSHDYYTNVKSTGMSEKRESEQGSFSKTISKDVENRVNQTSVQERSKPYTRQIAQDAEVKSKEEMTLEEYKSYIKEEIDKLPRSSAQNNTSIAVNISEKGFEAMQKDPEYEKWVLDGLRTSFSANDPWASVCGGSYTVHNFGATKEEYSGQGWYPGYQDGKGQDLFEAKSKDSTWAKRAEKKKELEEWNTELYNKKLLNQKLYALRGKSIGLADPARINLL